MNRTLVAALTIAAAVCLGAGGLRAACVNDLPNNVVEPGEVCDDGNTDNDDGCNNTCSSNNQCGNGVVDANKGEQCDEPANLCVGGTRDGQSCNSANTVDAMTSCYAGGASGTVGCFPDGAGSLVCCSEAFRVATLAGTPTCGGPFPGACVTCPYAPACAGVTCTLNCRDDASPNTCRSTCRLAGCGDGVQDSGETCDDILRNDGSDDDDNCPNGARAGAAGVACKMAQRCGDGFARLIDSSANCQGTACTAFPGTEECDAGGGVMVVDSTTSPAPKRCRNDPLVACNTDADCGTGPTATCGNADLPDHCRAACRNPACGDGILDSGESCDDGASNTDTVPGACRTNCATAACGNEVLDAGEECDAGNGDGIPAGDTPGDGDGTNGDVNNCTAACQCSFCGDGKIDTQSTDIPGACGTATNTAAEECDDGNPNENDGCLTTCVANVCGDGFRNQTGDPPAELCDDHNTTPDDGCSASCCNEVPDDSSSAATQLANADCNNADLALALSGAGIEFLSKRAAAVHKRITDARGNLTTNPKRACARIRSGLTKSLGLQRLLDRQGLPAVVLSDLTLRRARVAGWLAAAGAKLGCKL